MDKPSLPDAPAELRAAAVTIRQRFAAVSLPAARELVRAVARIMGALGCKSADEPLARAADLRQQLALPLTTDEVAEALLFVLFERWPRDAADAACLTAALTQASGGPVGGTADQMPGGSGPFGRVLTNPVPVAGIVAEHFYLNRLRTAAGLSVSWRRLGSRRKRAGRMLRVNGLPG